MRKIGFIGKTTVEVDRKAYKFSRELSYILVKLGYQIRHGGYKGGIMQAVSDGASQAISDFTLSEKYNVGVPESRFDQDGERTEANMFLEPAKDICDRLRGVVLDSDIIVVAPVGGDGTMLELQLAIHENTLANYGGRIRPIVICELEDETPWTEIINEQLKNLHNGLDGISDCSWIHVVGSLDEAVSVIQSLS